MDPLEMKGILKVVLLNESKVIEICLFRTKKHWIFLLIKENKGSNYLHKFKTKNAPPYKTDKSKIR